MPKLRNVAWLEQHFEEVVCPLASKVGSKVELSFGAAQIETRLKEAYYQATLFCGKSLYGFFFTWAVAVEKAKTLNRQILLPGRDAYLMAVLAQIARLDVIIRPDISTIVSPFVAEDYTQTVMVDSGYSGTCAVRMNIPEFLLVSTSKTNRQIVRGATSLLPSTSSSPYAPAMEGAPKYWERGFMEGDPQAASYYIFTNGPGPYTTNEQRKIAEKIKKGSPISMKPSDIEVIRTAFLLHSHIALNYTTRVINEMKEQAVEFVNNNQEWQNYLKSRESK